MPRTLEIEISDAAYDAIEREALRLDRSVLSVVNETVHVYALIIDAHAYFGGCCTVAPKDEQVAIARNIVDALGLKMAASLVPAEILELAYEGVPS